MKRVLFSFCHLPLDLIADDDAEALKLIDSNYKVIATIGYDWNYDKRHIIDTLKGAILEDIEKDVSEQFKEYFKGLLKRDIELLRKAEFWTPKSDKKRTHKSDVIKYLQNYKHKHAKGNYWASCAPYIDNCIKTLKEGL